MFENGRKRMYSYHKDQVRHAHIIKPHSPGFMDLFVRGEEFPSCQGFLKNVL